MFSGGSVELPTIVLVEGATGAGPITVTAVGDVLYKGPIDRPAGWSALINGTGGVMVLVGADRSLDIAGVRDDLVGLVTAGKLVAAYGRTPHAESDG